MSPGCSKIMNVNLEYDHLEKHSIWNVLIVVFGLTHDKIDLFNKFNKSTLCRIWSGPFAPTGIEIYDHSHLHEKNSCLSHINCNVNCFDKIYISVLFHNFSGYDSHFIKTKKKNNLQIDNEFVYIVRVDRD